MVLERLYPERVTPHANQNGKGNAEMALTKADIVEKLRATENMSKKDAFDLVEAAFEVMRQVIESSENLKIPRFGNFEVKEKNARKGRNPKSGEPLTIAARRVLTFKPSPVLKQQIDSDSL